MDTTKSKTKDRLSQEDLRDLFTFSIQNENRIPNGCLTHDLIHCECKEGNYNHQNDENDEPELKSKFKSKCLHNVSQFCHFLFSPIPK